MKMCLGSPATDEAQANDRINKMIKEDKKRDAQVIKLLLLGAGESGKSTIAKQMKLIHQDGFTDEERLSYTIVIIKNLMTSIKTLIRASRTFDIALPESLSVVTERVLKADNDSITPSIANDIKALWASTAIKSAYNRQAEYQLGDSAAYYLDSVERIAAVNFVPSDQDVLRSRAKTTGILVTEFQIEEVKFRMLDVGGQRSERRKWIHCFDDVTAVIFCVAMSEYDLKLNEDESINRMHESLRVFQEICTTPWLEKTDMILFLNKRDLFEEKIARVDLSVAFPEYKGGRDYEKAKVYIKEQFQRKNPNQDRTLYVHYTCATDTGNIAVVFNAVKDIILNKALESGGL